MTIPLLDAIAQAAPAPTAPAVKPPKGFEPGFRISPSGALESVTLASDADLSTEGALDAAARAQGIPLPEDMTLMVVEVRLGYNQASWHRDPGDKGAQHTAYTAPNSTWHYKLKVVPKSLWRNRDYDALVKDIRKAKGPKVAAVKSVTATEVVLLGDFQVGKTDHLGGTRELLERSDAALEQVLAKLRKSKPAEIVLIDLGDALEGFTSAPNAAQTNDLDQTEQLTVWRRIFWTWVAALARLGIPMKVLGVPSNHCRVRTGKAVNGKPNDDWGLQTIGTLMDMAALNPEAYGHVEFYVPQTHDEHLALTLVGGKTIGAVHGHQKSSVGGLLQWCEGQAAGRSPVGHADIVFAGHYHHLEINTWGDDRWLFVAPTMDAGSSWYSNLTGRKSRNGVLTVTVDEHGWRDLLVAWA